MSAASEWFQIGMLKKGSLTEKWAMGAGNEMVITLFKRTCNRQSVKITKIT